MACSTRLSAKIIRMARAVDEFEEKKVAKPLKIVGPEDSGVTSSMWPLVVRFNERE